MYTISKEFHFSAAHQLYGLEADHPCGRLHGHNYVIIVELQAKELNDTGFVLDYGELRDIKQWIDNILDHQNLNEVLPIDQPSAENIARYVFDMWHPAYPAMSAIHVKETPKTVATYRPDYD